MAKEKINISANEFAPESAEYEKVSEDTTRFWNFSKNNTLYCKFLGEEELDYQVFRVLELTEKREYYLPDHKKLREAYEKNKKAQFKIVYLDTVTFDKGKKTFTDYDIFIVK